MKYTNTERVLLFIADCMDQSILQADYKIAIRNMVGDFGHPVHREWIEKIINDRKKRKQFRSALQNIERGKYIIKKKLKGLDQYELSEKGKLKVLQTKIKSKEFKLAKNDEIIIVLYDIPEKLHKTRDDFRHVLKTLGCGMVQQSVWISFHNILQEIEEAIAILDIQRNVEVLTAQRKKHGFLKRKLK